MSEVSLAASKTHVFLTWHDIRFEVPNKDGEPAIPSDAIAIDRIQGTHQPTEATDQDEEA